MSENQVTKQDIANAIGNTSIADSILANFSKLADQGQLVFPKGKNVGNELKLMYTSLSQNNLLSQASPISIGEALCEAVIQGLEIEKKQLYFIVYARRMVMIRSYYGDVAVAKNTGLVKDVRARVIYEGDEFDVDTDEDGQEYITGHRTKLSNHDNSIVGAYAWAEMHDGKRLYCIMTWKEIQANWSKSKDTTRNVHKEFPQEMAKRTVIRRLVKMIFNTTPSFSDEQKVLVRSYNRTTEEEYENKDYSTPTKKTTVTNTLDFEDDESIIDIPETTIKENDAQ